MEKVEHRDSTEIRKQKIKRTSLIILGLIFVSLFALSYQICDRYCFDTLIYRKNSFIARQFGYKEEQGNLCTAQLNSSGFREEELYPKKEGEYLVLIIGDSVVYGQGLLKNQRFSEKLEKKLSDISPTRVLNLGECGTNIYQHYDRAIKYDKMLNPDLIVFGYTWNDLLVWESMVNYPEHLPSDDLVLEIRDGEFDDYSNMVLASYDENRPNVLMAEYIAPLVSKDNTILFSFEYYGPEDLSHEYNIKLERVLDFFRKNEIEVIDAKNLFREKYLENSRKNNGQDYMFISQIEKHPNSLANRMFAERLYEVINQNPKYGFIK